MNQVFLITIYLTAIVAANLSITYFGPQAAIVNAFLLVGPLFTLRDQLHELWQGEALVWRMGLLIAAGSSLSYLLNQDAGPIALASFLAFLVSESCDWTVFRALQNHPWMVRSNGSNLAGAAVDSLIFPVLAFGGLPLGIMAGQFVAKAAGGLVWSWLLRKTRWPITASSPR